MAVLKSPRRLGADDTLTAAEQRMLDLFKLLDWHSQCTTVDALDDWMDEQAEKEAMEAADRLRQSDRLLAAIQENLTRATRNRHNLEVLLSLATFIRAHLDMLTGFGRIEELFEAALDAHAQAEPAEALQSLTKACDLVPRILDDTDSAYRSLVRVWEKSRYPRNAAFDGREFLHVMDDVKDHFADRRADLSYHVAPFETIGLRQYAKRLAKLTRTYAGRHGLTAPQP